VEAEEPLRRALEAAAGEPGCEAGLLFNLGAAVQAQEGQPGRAGPDEGGEPPPPAGAREGENSKVRKGIDALLEQLKSAESEETGGRAVDSSSNGRRFESCRAHHSRAVPELHAARDRHEMPRGAAGEEISAPAVLE